MSENSEPAPQKIFPFLAAFKSPEGRNVVHIHREKGGPRDAEQAGMFLVDLARHYARMFTQIGVVRDEDEALDQIRRSFDAEWDAPTDLGEGGIPS